MQDISKEVLIKASDGDLRSFEDVYKATASFVYNVAYRIVYNRQDAQDVAQEVFLNVYRKLKDFRFQSSFKTWVYRITVNTAINYSKRSSRERDRNKEYGAYADPGPALDKSAVLNESDKDIIELFLRELNPDQRACVVLRNVEGLDYRQIADILRVNINTVRSRLKRAREKLLAKRREVRIDEL
jgi:RNA polymerase sigma-70 factor (ECF subfamily)